MQRKYVILLALLLLTAACIPGLPTLQPESQSQGEVQQPETAPESVQDAAPPAPEAAEADPTDSPTEPPTSSPPTDTADPVASTGEEKPDCEYSAQLHATDPSGVSLASGKVQLVEFFAFW